jgi:uncharacterized protein
VGMLQDFIRRLRPQEDRFFDLLERQAIAARDAAAMLATFGADASAAELSVRLQKVEHAGDALAHELEDLLARTYVTPIDREDIHGLSNALDEVLDHTNRAARVCDLMGVIVPTKPMTGLLDVLRHSTVLVADAVPLLRQRDQANIFVAKRSIRDLEKTADRLHRDAIREMFATEWDDPRRILRERAVLEQIEEAINQCEHIGGLLALLAIKYA